jgi:threonine dehydrogenase-like Zn-dependent dehydrogenase
MSAKILLQLDPDSHASVFDSVVAVDSGIDHLFRESHVKPEQVRDLVYGCLFTRGGENLKNSAIFVGGSQVAPAEELLKKVVATFMGPFSVSVMFDANGCNTTASAAVLAARRHIDLSAATALVLAGTGPVGQRVARLLAKAGAAVRVGSRQLDKAQQVCGELKTRVPGASFSPAATLSHEDLGTAIENVDVIISAGAPGVQLISSQMLTECESLRVAIDLNAVPPVGMEGVKSTDRAADREGVIYYGALGVGSTKMKIHKAALQKLFTDNSLVLDAEEIYEIGESLEPGGVSKV